MLSDEAEWEKLNKPHIMTVLSPEQSALVRATRPERILSSRMVRRWKPQEGLNAPPTPKSRWCVRGFDDPDTGSLTTYAPTPQVESLMIFALVMLGEHMDQALLR